MRIGIYGGSFNPPHLGHYNAAKRINEKLGLDKIIVIPSNISPQKSNNGNIDPAHRLNMCRLQFSDDVFDISDIEINRGGKSYTVDTVTAISNMYPGSELFLFMGSDMFLSFGSWYMPDRIMELCTVCTLSREEDDTADKLLGYAKTVLKTDKVVVVDVPPFEVSSTAIRNGIAEGADISAFVSPQVEKYIKDNRLYGK